MGEFSPNVGLTESLTSLDIVIVIIQATQIIPTHKEYIKKIFCCLQMIFYNILTKNKTWLHRKL